MTRSIFPASSFADRETDEAGDDGRPERCSGCRRVLDDHEGDPCDACEPPMIEQIETRFDL